MNLLHWFSRDNKYASAAALYKRGFSKAQSNDRKGAIDAYTSAIDRQDAPEDVKAMALYNRSLLLASGGDKAKAVIDLRALLAIAAPLREIKAAAKRRLDRMQRQHDMMAHGKDSPAACVG